MGFESAWRKEQPLSSIDDYDDAPEIKELLLALPPELRAKHLLHIEQERLDDSETLHYLAHIREGRERAMTESVVSDPSIQELFEAHEEEVWRALETDVFYDSKNALGAGQTAKVKSFVLNDAERGISMPFAIKYLLTPTAKTLSASGEHDLIREVERIERIERAESEHLDENLHFRVPHPYFHHRTEKLQCYGMELIDGTDLQKFMDGEHSDELREELREALAGVSRDALMREIDAFCDVMHTVCIHGDVKFANIMINREGRFYLIDFGQSVLLNDVSEKDLESFENLKADEKAKMRTLLTHFLNELLG